MKQCLPALILFFLAFWAMPLFGQDQDYVCPFDSTRFDTVVVIDPMPLDPETGMGGIPDTACANTPYEFTFAVSVPDTALDFGDLGQAILFSLFFDPDTALTYDPPMPAFDYVCDPPTCQFDRGTTGCVKIFGTAGTEDLGDHELQLTGFIDIGLGLPLPVVFPDPALFPGTYIVNVQDQTFGNCLVAGVESLADEVSIRNYPNPFTETTQVIVEAERAKQYEYRIVDMLGKVHYTQRVETVQGTNVFDIDGSRLAPGMYFFHLTDGRGVLTRKLIRR